MGFDTIGINLVYVILGNISCISWIYLGYILGISREYLGYMSGISWIDLQQYSSSISSPNISGILYVRCRFIAGI